MKYLKLYKEQIEDDLQIGDYVFCDETGHSNTLSILDNFLLINIGQLVKMQLWDNRSEVVYLIQYENIPKTIQSYFEFDNVISNCRRMSRNEIKYWSKNKEDLEIMLDQNKYNL